MRPTVAIVETRPETVGQDYGRLLDLAGLAPLRGEEPPALAAGSAARWEPGASTPPWQLDGFLEWFAAGPAAGTDSRAVVFPVGHGGSRRARPDASWDTCLARGRARLAGESDWTLRPVRPASALPALARSVGDGFFIPAGWRDRTLIAMPVIGLAAGWLVHGAVELLGRVLAPRWRRDRRIPRSEVRAEIAQLAVEVFPRLGVVMDGTVWSVAQGRRNRPVARNVILAGTDPVAVDAVALRLAGLDPLRVPWMRLCTERGTGVCDPAAMDIVGNRKLLELDFAIPRRTFADRPARAASGVLGWWRRLAAGRPVAPMPWSDLYREICRDGDTGARA